MSNESSPICPQCGAVLKASAPAGLCPNCLMAMNLAVPTEIPGETGPHGTKVIEPPPPPADIAKHFPQFEILECLGRGGMGVVYKARQHKLNRIIALKILAPEKGAEPKFAEWFEREAQALARLNHPNIVTVHDFGETDGLFYLLMEYVDGVSLRQLLQTKKITPEEALAIVPKICEALQFAHEQGVVHRDIKPENVLLDKNGRVKIADFGIAKILGGAGLSLFPAVGEREAISSQESKLTQGQILGTPHYMAPEQVEKPQTVDHRADIYSLGVVFYEMLTGELPLGRFQPPSKKVQVDVRLDDVVLHALEKEPDRRYQHASQVKSDVETIAVTPQSPTAPPAKRIAATWKFAIPTAAAVIIFLGIVLGGFWRKKGPQDGRQTESSAKAVAGNDRKMVINPAIFDEGQVYPPDTDYHDAVQRLFVLEAARVLAWRANQMDGDIANITYRLGVATSQVVAAGVTNQSDRTVVWSVNWLDSRGKTNKSARVEYREALLTRGAEFYRQTFKQLWAAGWSPLLITDYTSREHGFWQGAGQADWSREKSLMTAEQLLVIKRENENWIAQLSGLLVHTALPGIAGNLSIDRELIARGAAWLALSEQGCTNPSVRLWSPVMFLAEREQAAATAWHESSKRMQTNEIIKAWDLWLSRPTSKEVYLFAVDSDCSPIALAMLAYDVQAYWNAYLFAEMIEPLAGDVSRVKLWHNYAPLLAGWAGIGGGRILEGAWPMYQRRAWLELMKQHSQSPYEKIDFAKELKIAAEAPDRETRERDADASLTGFTNFTPLLQLGFLEGVGRLAPTAVASTRDLLNYGWESTGLQMGERYNFVNWRWGFPLQAKPIRQTVTREVNGLLPFFLNAESANAHNYQASLHRLQNVDGFYSRVGWSPHPFSGDKRSAGTAAVFTRRCWLRSSEFEWQIQSFWNEGNIGSASELIDNIKSESGPIAASRALKYLVSIGEDSSKAFRRETNPSLAAMLAQPTANWATAVWNEKFKLSSLAIAQELEKAYWRNQDSGLENWVLHFYAEAGAFSTARRFYLQARDNFMDPVSVSFGIGESAFVLGYCLDDPILRNAALKDSSSGSSGDMIMRVWEAALRDNRKDMSRIADMLIDRYETSAGADSRARRLRDFLPLLDALAEASHPDHGRAIDFFGNSDHWIFLRWIWIEKFKLSQKDAITFLGGREANPTVHALVSALEGDAAKAKRALRQRINKGDLTSSMMVLASYSSRKVSQDSFNAEAPDLKPPGATSTRAAVLAKLKAKRNSP